MTWARDRLRRHRHGEPLDRGGRRLRPARPLDGLRRHHEGERGAVLVLVAIVLSTLIGFTSLAIDIGYQRVVRRDMQAVADVIALDLSRRLDGRTAQTIMNDTAFPVRHRRQP